MSIYPKTKTPGVQIDEILLGSPPIVGVSTSVGGFVGTAPNPDASITANANVPRLIASEDEFVQIFASDVTRSNDLTRAVIGFFRNGGQQCFVVHVPSPAPATPAPVNALTEGLKALELEEVNLLAVPGRTEKPIYQAMQDQAVRKGDRFAILDPPQKTNDPLGDFSSGGAGPAPDGLKRPPPSFYSAFYYPRIVAAPHLRDDPVNGEPASPSGYLAGMYARVDSSRGVHKAPANEVLRGALDVEHRLTDADQNVLNDNNVNLIRNFGGTATVWGGRTLVQKNPSGKDIEYRYISTRRLVNYVEQSLKLGLNFAVFEPNNIPLQNTVARSARGFLDALWRDGALYGESPEDSYYVRFPPLYNTDNDRKLGLLVMEVGLRVAYPAEFIIIRIGPLSASPNA